MMGGERRGAGHVVQGLTRARPTVVAFLRSNPMEPAHPWLRPSLKMAAPFAKQELLVTFLLLVAGPIRQASR